MQSLIGTDGLTLALDGLYKAMGQAGRDPKQPHYCDACFTGDYPVELTDHINGKSPPQLSLLQGENLWYQSCADKKTGRSLGIGNGASEDLALKSPSICPTRCPCHCQRPHCGGLEALDDAVKADGGNITLLAIFRTLRKLIVWQPLFMRDFASWISWLAMLQSGATLTCCTYRP